MHSHATEAAIAETSLQLDEHKAGRTGSKWHAFYADGFMPWDTHAVASQLAFFLTARCVCPLLAQPQQGTAALPPPNGDEPGLSMDDTGAVLVQQSRGVVGWLPDPPTNPCAVCAPHRLLNPAAADVLELGCGTGSCMVFAARMGFTAVGVDLVPAAVEAARASAAHAGVASAVTFIPFDLFELPLPFSPEAAKALASCDSRSHSPNPHNPIRPLSSNGQGFDLVFDCQSFHVLRDVDETKYVRLLAASLKPGGHLLLLAGADGDADAGPALGPPRLPEQALRAAFAPPDWGWVWLVRTRFDMTPHYAQAFPRPPMAWWGLLRRLSRDAEQ